MRLTRVPVGIGAPNVLQQTLTVDGSVPSLTDLTTVTGISLLVGVPGQASPVTWTATVYSATAPGTGTLSSLVWRHVFAPTDCVVEGIYVITAQLTVPGGVIPCDSVRLYVTSVLGDG